MLTLQKVMNGKSSKSDLDIFGILKEDVDLVQHSTSSSYVLYLDSYASSPPILLLYSLWPNLTEGQNDKSVCKLQK